MYHEIINQVGSKYGIKIVYLVELDSHTYGYASKTSDHDYIGVFVRDIKDYHRITLPREEYQFKANECDYKLYDIHKFFRLLSKSNPTLIEAIMVDKSFIIINDLVEFERLKEEISRHFSRSTLFYHYLSIAKKNFLNLEDKRKVQVKMYVIILRSLLSALYILKNGEIPPLNVFNLCEHFSNISLSNYLIELVKLRKKGIEEITRNSSIEKMVDEYLSMLYLMKDRVRPDVKLLDEILWKNLVKHCVNILNLRVSSIGRK